MSCKDCEPFGGEGWIDLAFSRARCDCNPEDGDRPAHVKVESTVFQDQDPVYFSGWTLEDGSGQRMYPREILKIHSHGPVNNPGTVQDMRDLASLVEDCPCAVSRVKVRLSEELAKKAEEARERLSWTSQQVADAISKQISNDFAKAYAEDLANEIHGKRFWEEGIRLCIERRVMTSGGEVFTVESKEASHGERVVKIFLDSMHVKTLQSSDTSKLARDVYSTWRPVK